MSFPAGTPTTSFTLHLVCGHQVEHTEWEGVAPEDRGWVVGAGRWCAPCDHNSTVQAVAGHRGTRQAAASVT